MAPNTPTERHFVCAIEEGLLDPKRVVQIGIRGTMYDGEDIEWGREHGVTIISIDEARERGHSDVMKEAREIVGDTETYVSFDIDFIDPAFAPGTGTPEIGGPDTWVAQQYVRGLSGVNVIGADLVEISPPFDPSGNTAWVGASILFELLCVVSESVKGPGSMIFRIAVVQRDRGSVSYYAVKLRERKT